MELRTCIGLVTLLVAISTPSESTAIEPFISGSTATAIIMDDDKPNPMVYFVDLQENKALHNQVFNAWRLTPDPSTIADAILGVPLMQVSKKPKAAFSLTLQRPGENARGLLRVMTDGEPLSFRLSFGIKPRHGLLSEREFASWSNPGNWPWKVSFFKKERVRGTHSAGLLSEPFIEPFQRHEFIITEIPDGFLHQAMRKLEPAGVVIGSVRHLDGKWTIAGEISICAD